MGTKINRVCPVCDQPLFAEAVEGGKTVVYCGYGPCPSRVTNEGATESTEEEAYDNLCRMVQEELMMNEDYD